ncbi:hypothetical protein DesLBE_0931 [Desulfitobacterium sp. LBE]|uniref:Uncharacterized protein n=5 Tax=root TaxID=1 RepID=Q24XW6_DESHY|nr:MULTISPECIES: hypothetical protein [Desulfitobacterium]ACL20493.1 hypothetical protein Dhaf_2465 [Desulfitobacterium hafniense DCB-2]EHL04311.1 hypothetical protein HMPREF0322_05005 [Desulfitobacterium hafniense DP7]KTE92377.1 hypothetical protein AT727_19505 [Desulfitobacterium hafniense]MEA5025990.1 hypothetical protein [Desulfitobacterium hafniense]TWH56685.1 hypothetical protein DesLBE_0931 [Desulfitobacterium sp. LBE]
MNIKKILAGITGIGLIVLLLLFVNAWVGNPVSNLLAKQAAQKYIDVNYSNLDLEIQSSNYNFKFDAYLVFVQSSLSEDTAFSIYTDSYGKVLRDDYEYEVANNFTTYRRLDAEMREIAKKLIGSRLDYDFDYISFQFTKEDHDLMKLERDMKLDISHPPLPLVADVVLYSEDLSYSKVAEVAKALEAILKEESIPVSQYSVRLLPLANKPAKEDQAAPWVNSLSLSDFPAEHMAEDNLPQVMEQFEADRVAELNAKDKK